MKAKLSTRQQGMLEFIRHFMEEHEENRKQNAKLASRIQINLVHCPVCARGTLLAICESGHGEAVTSNQLLAAELDPEIVRGCLGIV